MNLDESIKNGQNFVAFMETKVYKTLTDKQFATRIREFFPEISIPVAYFLAKGINRQQIKE